VCLYQTYIKGYETGGRSGVRALKMAMLLFVASLSVLSAAWLRNRKEM